MKKFKYILSLNALSSIALLPVLTSCSNYYVKDKLVLRSISDASLIGKDDFDYWLCAEPVVTSKTKALKLHNVGDVQTLYGGDGYNQAVLIAKNNLLTDNQQYLHQVKNYLDGNYNYISDENNTKQIIENINNNLSKGKSPTLTSTNTTTQTLINCNAKRVEHETDKQSYIKFLDKASEIDSTVTKPENPEKFYSGFPAENKTQKAGEYKIICPDGAPAVGLANLLANKDKLPNTTKFEFVDPTTIMQKTIKESADLAVLPSNVAAKIVKLGHDYVWLTTITWGNLYILSSKFDKIINKENIKDVLINKNMEVMNLPQVPGLVLKIILKDNNINYVEK